MLDSIQRHSGKSFLIGSFLLLATMLLHPAPANLARLREMIFINLIAHSIGIFAMPFMIVGFIGLARWLNGWWSCLSLVTISIGFFAGIIAAAINGLVLPILLLKTDLSIPSQVERVRSMFWYSSAVNHAFDFIFIGFILIALLIWSFLLLLQTANMKKIGIFGLLLVSIYVVLIGAGFSLVALHGFRFFVLGFIGWCVWLGLALSKEHKIR